MRTDNESLWEWAALGWEQREVRVIVYTGAGASVIINIPESCQHTDTTAGTSSSSYNYITFQLYLIMRIKHIFGLNIYTNFTKSKIIQYGSTSVAGLRQADVKKRIKSNVD